MKRFLIALLSAIAVTGVSGQTNDLFFQLPIVPDSLTSLQNRSDYLVEHYWDFCDLNKAFSSKEKMATAFDTYLSFMPYASATTVYREVERFMKQIGKKTDNVLFIGEQAEAKLYSDTAYYPSDELFALFCNEIVKNKKVDKNSKLRYQHLATVLTGSAPGAIAPMFDYTDAFGQKGTLAVDTTRIGTILFFNDPDCDDCNMARLRLETDVITRKLIDGRKMDMVSVYASEPNSEWIEKAIDYPESWKTIASEEAAGLYDLRISPIFYVINPNGAILLKTADVNAIISIMGALSGRLNL